MSNNDTRDEKTTPPVEENPGDAGATSAEETSADDGGAEAPEAPPEDPKKVAFLEGLTDDVETLKDLVWEYKTQADSSLDDHRRTLAEFANYRRRMTEEASLARTRGKADLLEALLPALDDIDQGVKNTETSSGEQVKKGLTLLQQKVRQILTSQDFEIIDPTGQPFDPEVADALTTVPHPEMEPDTVLETFSPCYKFKGHVLRPAKVVVTRSPEE